MSLQTARSLLSLSLSDALERKSLKTAVAFTARIRDSKAVADGFADVVARYASEQKEAGRPVEGTLDVEVEHVDGSMPTKVRKQKLAWLAETPEDEEFDEPTCRILSNAKCLTEGVDLPQLDAVVFFQPRSSQVDIIQAVGRVMRKASNKQYGYVILPVVVPDGADPDAVLASSDFKTVWDILQALRSHDERLDAKINALSLHRKAVKNRRAVKKDNRVRLSKAAVATDNGDDLSNQRRTDREELSAQQDMLGFYDELPEQFQAYLVKKCGDTAYWDDWADSVSAIATKTLNIIRDVIQTDEPIKAEFATFLAGIHATLNPNITEADATGMLAQHILTEPIFEALFEHASDASGASFASSNPMSLALAPITELLRPKIAVADPSHELAQLYAQVRLQAGAVRSDDAARQKLVKDLYESFFRTAFRDDADKLGIVYTPTEIVDYILKSVDKQLFDHFGQHIGDLGVNILDPFTGTGTFIVELLRLGLIPPENLAAKYESEIFANEIMLLAYYIAMVNIESEYLAATKADTYAPFPGGVLTDTFLAGNQKSGQEQLDSELFAKNSERVKRQNEQPITVIIGNPPYSAGQKSANDNNANEHYEVLDQRIEDTYVAETSATGKRKLYDSYIRAFRWASDRIAGENGDGRGIIGFVSGGGWLDNIAFNGFRKSLVNEFSDIYVFDLLGNKQFLNLTKEDVARQGDNVFASQSKTPIAVTLLVHDPSADHQGVIHYRDIGEYLSREDKLTLIDEAPDSDDFTWQTIIPDEHGDWVDQRDDLFNTFAPVGLEKWKNPMGLFSTYSMGLVTARDTFSFGFSRNAVSCNIRTLINTYTKELYRYDRAGKFGRAEDFFTKESNLIKWSRSLVQQFERGDQIEHSDEFLTQGIYRPFTKQWVYYDRRLVEMMLRWSILSPLKLLSVGRDEVAGKTISRPIVNRFIDVPGPGKSVISCFLTELPTCFGTTGNDQCFPLYWYEESKSPATDELTLDFGTTLAPGDVEVTAVDGTVFIRHDAITDETLDVFRSAYPDNAGLALSDVSAAKEQVFYYIYGLLHSPEYRERFASNLRKELPRIPLAQDFDAFSVAGRRLADLHAGYEDVERYVSADDGADGRIVEDWSSTDHSNPGRIEKMRFGKTAKSAENPKGVDKSVIVVNGNLTLRNIPLDAYGYEVSGRSAIEWVMDQYQVKTDKKSGIIKDPNDWVGETGNPRYIVDLIESLVTVSLGTQKIVDSLPKLNELAQPANWPEGW